jgi:[protein-PII] uridylyltransferase
MGVRPDCWDWHSASRIRNLYHKAEAFLLAKELDTRAVLTLPAGYEEGGTQIFLTDDFNGNATILTVVTPDAPHLFSNILGVLAKEGCEILSAEANTVRREDGNPIAVDKFILAKALEDRQKTRLSAALETILKTPEQADFGQSIRGFFKAESTKHYPLTPNIEFDDNASETDTFIKVTARDKPELLYKLACAFNEAGLNLRRARITTHGHKAVDSFYVQDSKGRKVDKAEYPAIAAAITRLIS